MSASRSEMTWRRALFSRTRRSCGVMPLVIASRNSRLSPTHVRLRSYVVRQPTGLVAGLVVALALPTAALGARRVIHGPAGSSGSGTVDITLVAKNGNVKKLTRFEFNNIPATCAGFAPTATSGTFPHTITVNSKAKFHASVKQNGGRVTSPARTTLTRRYCRQAASVRRAQ